MFNILDECAERLKPLKGPHRDRAATAVISAMLAQNQLRSELANSNLDAVVAILNRASKIRFTENTLAEPAFRQLGVDAVLDRIAPRKASEDIAPGNTPEHIARRNALEARRTALVLNAASHAGNDVCTDVMESLVTRQAFGQLMESQQPMDIAMAMNAAAHARKEVCFHVMRRAVNEHPEKFKALMDRGDPHHVALALSATANAGEDICAFVLKHYPIAIERVMAYGNSQDVAMALKAAMSSSDPQRHCHEALKRWSEDTARPSDQLRLMTPYQASIWTEAVAASGLGGLPEAPHLDTNRRELHCHVGALRVADAACRARAGGSGSKELRDIPPARLRELRAETLKSVVKKCSRHDDGRPVVDLHYLHHHVAEDVIRHVLSTTPPDPLPVFIAGRGSHRQDGANPMADLVNRLCGERRLRATPDPHNPGLLLVESSATPHRPPHRDVPTYAEILAQMSRSQSERGTGAPAHPAGHTRSYGPTPG